MPDKELKAVIRQMHIENVMAQKGILHRIFLYIFTVLFHSKYSRRNNRTFGEIMYKLINPIGGGFLTIDELINKHLIGHRCKEDLRILKLEKRISKLELKLLSLKEAINGK